MGIYPQPNAWQCGPFALKHALLTLGIVEHERKLTRLSGANEYGADETELARAAQHCGCDLLTVRCRVPGQAREELLRWLARQVPVLLCIEQWNHWVTVAGFDEGAFVLLDSRELGVFRLVPWETLEAVWGYRTRRGTALYDLHPVVPARGARAWARFSRARAEYLRRSRNRDLAHGWAAYLAPLLDIAPVRLPQAELTVPLIEVLSREQDALLATAQGAEGGGPPDRARRRMGHVRFVADTYALEVSPDLEEAAVGILQNLIGSSPWVVP
jgi:hypothetical protein